MANINFSSFFSKNKNPQNQGANNSNNYQSPYFSQQVSHLQNMQAQQMGNQGAQRQPVNYSYQQVSQNNSNQQNYAPRGNSFNNQTNTQQNSRPVYIPQAPVQGSNNTIVKDPNYTESSFDKELSFLNNVKRNIPVKTEEEKNVKEKSVDVSDNPFVVKFPEKKEHIHSFDNKNNDSLDNHNFDKKEDNFFKNEKTENSGFTDFNVQKQNTFQKINDEKLEEKEEYVKNNNFSENHNFDKKEELPNVQNMEEISEETDDSFKNIEKQEVETKEEVVEKKEDYLEKENEYLKDREVHKLEHNAEIVQLEVDKIEVNPFQPRKEFNEEAIDELASSIREYGVLEPLIVRRIQKEDKTEYQLIAGERRLRASKRAGLKKVPVIFKDIKNDAIVLELALIENVQREDLSSIAKAKSYARLIEEFGYTQEVVGSRVGKSRASIANTLRLLQLPYEAQKALGDGKITESHARALLLLPNMEKQRTLLNEILTKQLSSRESHLIAKQFVSGSNNNLAPKRVMRGFNQEDLELREMLETKFGTKVSIKRKGDSGEILIHFDSSDELNGIVNKITSQAKRDLDKSVQNLM